MTLLTPWEAFLLAMPLDDWLDMETCDCEGRCTCDER